MRIKFITLNETRLVPDWIENHSEWQIYNYLQLSAYTHGKNVEWLNMWYIRLGLWRHNFPRNTIQWRQNQRSQITVLCHSWSKWHTCLWKHVRIETDFAFLMILRLKISRFVIKMCKLNNSGLHYKFPIYLNSKA